MTIAAPARGISLPGGVRSRVDDAPTSLPPLGASPAPTRRRAAAAGGRRLGRSQAAERRPPVRRMQALDETRPRSRARRLPLRLACMRTGRAAASDAALARGGPVA